MYLSLYGVDDNHSMIIQWIYNFSNIHFEIYQESSIS